MGSPHAPRLSHCNTQSGPEAAPSPPQRVGLLASPAELLGARGRVLDDRVDGVSPAGRVPVPGDVARMSAERACCEEVFKAAVIVE